MNLSIMNSYGTDIVADKQRTSRDTLNLPTLQHVDSPIVPHSSSPRKDTSPLLTRIVVLAF